VPHSSTFFEKVAGVSAVDTYEMTCCVMLTHFVGAHSADALMLAPAARTAAAASSTLDDTDVCVRSFVRAPVTIGALGLAAVTATGDDARAHGRTRAATVLVRCVRAVSSVQCRLVCMCE
jgi:hypothetical protein